MLGLALTLAGLLHRDILDRSIVQPDFEPYASHVVEARGWLLAWLVTKPATAQLPLHVTERLLISRFLVCWTGATAVSGSILLAFRKRGLR